MKTSLGCIFGHKWSLKEVNRKDGPNGETLSCEVKLHPLPFCHRCGKSNPNFDHVSKLTAIIKEDIKKHELICNLAKQNQHAN